MRKLFLSVLLFVSPFIIIAIIMEFLLRQTQNDYLYKKEYLNTNSNTINTLILGSSHAFYGIDPIYFSSNAFNASHISQSLFYDYQILKMYENKFDSLNTVVLPISYFTLYFDLGLSNEPWRTKNYVIYYGIGDPNLSILKSIKYNSELLSNRFNINVKRMIRFIFKGTNISCSKFGWGTDFKSDKAVDLVRTGKINASGHHRDIHSREIMSVYEKNNSILKSIIEWSDTMDVKVILITPPAFEAYRQYLNTDQLNNTIEVLTDLDSNYNNCVYINLLFDTVFVAEDFYDADHLNEIGAQKLSTIINGIIGE